MTVAVDTMVVEFMNFSAKFMADNVKFLYGKLSHMVLPTLGSIVAIMLILHTFDHHQNIGASFVKSLFKKLITLGIIYACLCNWDLVSQLFVDTWSGMSELVATKVLSAFSGVRDSLPMHLQKIFIKATYSANGFVKNGSLINIGPRITAVVMLYLVVGAITMLIIEIMICKITMLLLVALLPIILPFLLFDSTRGIVSRALGLLTSSAFVIVFASFASVLVIGVCDQFLNRVVDKNSFDGLIPVLLVGSFCMSFAVAAFKMGKDIGGSVSIASGAGGTMGDMAGHARRPINAMSNASRSATRSTMAGGAALARGIGNKFLRR